MIGCGKFRCLLMSLLILACVPAARPQRTRPAPSRVPESQSPPATHLQTIARDLSDKSQDTFNLAFNQRQQMPVDLYVALAGFAGTTIAYSQMAGDDRDPDGLRNSARRIVGGAREIDGLFRSGTPYEVGEAWQIVQGNIVRLSDNYGLGYRPASRVLDVIRSRPGQPATPATPVAGGRFRWRGRVDGVDYILLQGSSVSIRHVEYGQITDASYELPYPLPQSPVQARLNKMRGRGTVEIVRQPSASNNFTLTVLIEDPAGGSDYYEFEVNW